MNTKFILILKNGKVMPFNVLACAELYQQIYGGTLIKETLLNPELETL